jgi:hypothetical protein
MLGKSLFEVGGSCIYRYLYILMKENDFVARNGTVQGGCLLGLCAV